MKGHKVNIMIYRVKLCDVHLEVMKNTYKNKFKIVDSEHNRLLDKCQFLLCKELTDSIYYFQDVGKSL